MEINDLIQRFSSSTENQCKAIFSTLFIAGNQLQSLFDKNVPDITLKQFMLLTMVHQSQQQLTLTQSGKLLGCSRQNVKKLAVALEKKGFVTILQNEKDSQASCLQATDQLSAYFDTVFSVYQEQLSYLFEVYTPQEIEQLFSLMMKLYAGIEHLKEKTHASK